jgi:hypothetical protein
MDHSTNPLSSDLYKIRFKHSTKQWPSGRFSYYKEKLDKSDGRIINITCTRTIPIVPKRKKREENEQNMSNTTPSVVVANPTAQEQKKILADEQRMLYTGMFRIPKVNIMFILMIV